MDGKYSFDGFTPVRMRMEPFDFDIDKNGRIKTYENTELSEILDIRLSDSDIGIPVDRYVKRWPIKDNSAITIIDGYNSIIEKEDISYFETESYTPFFRKEGYPLHIHLCVKKRGEDTRSEMRDESTAALQGSDLDEILLGLSQLGHDMRPEIMRLGTNLMELEKLIKQGKEVDIPSVIDYIDNLKRNVRSFGETSDTLLQLTTGTYGDVEKKHIDMYSDVIIPSIEPFFGAIKKKDIKLDYDVSFNRWEVFSDPKLLKQIVKNYISNATKYTPPRGRISWGAKPQLYESEDWFNIYNTGEPISDGQIDEIFKPFVRGDDIATNGEKGYGIGLASSSRAARKLGERIWAEKGRKEGASFYVSVKRE